MPLSKIDSDSLNSGLTFSGQQTIPTINLTGGQITFPATQVPSANANTLDDYEEGTWTPTLVGSGGNPTVNYNEQFGRYVKIGNQVTVQFYLAPNSYSGGAGFLQIGGLPFISSNARHPTSSAGAFYMVNFQVGGFVFPSIGVNGNSTNAEVLIYNNNGGWAGPSLSCVPTGSYSAIQATLTYSAAA